MSSIHFRAESSSVETPLQQRSKSSHLDVDAARAERPLERGVAKREEYGWRTLINYISGGQGGSGGRGGVHGGAGGAGEGPTLQYDIKAQRVVMKTFNGPEATPSDFLRIPLGHIDLRSVIRMDAATGAVSRRRERKSVRRMYTARVVGHNEPMTVALYQGHNAEEEWKRDLSRHSGVRHPNILQIYASASSSGIHATVFHDDLVLFEQFFDSFRDSAVLRAYIRWYTVWTASIVFTKLNLLQDVDIQDAATHCVGLVSAMRNIQAPTYWIRRSTGRLCIELRTSETEDTFEYGPVERLPPQTMLSLHDPNQESLVTASLGYPEWYSLCDSYLCQYGFCYISVRAEVRLGSIICWLPGSRFEHVLEIASTTDAQITSAGWSGPGSGQRREDDGAISSARSTDSQISGSVSICHDDGHEAPTCPHICVVRGARCFFIVDAGSVSPLRSAPSSSPPSLPAPLV
ncbi:hypothetical protein MSAN_01107100 [Mycena sanguinolenta]|uniref:Protein kinase domain-containing protein n=1 Tax=Mycena sanguinolenta TaxID=230812 RepID=A0A8H6YSM6_9AGAR|nr:hypothetical protein MSAN_01107100 [Mycena sanguinolenta]